MYHRLHEITWVTKLNISKEMPQNCFIVICYYSMAPCILINVMCD